MSVDLYLIRIILVITGKRANPVRREKFVFVQHAAEHPPQLLAVHQRQEPADAARRTLRDFKMFRQASVIVDEPLHTPLKTGKPVDHFGLQCFHGEKRNQSHH